jgi:hypothetical protein
MLRCYSARPSSPNLFATEPEIRWQRTSRPWSPQSYDCDSDTNCSDGPRESNLGLHAHPRCAKQSQASSGARNYCQYSQREWHRTRSRTLQKNDLARVLVRALGNDRSGRLLHGRGVDAPGPGSLFDLLRSGACNPSRHVAGITSKPNSIWMNQVARNLTDPENGFLRGK